MFLYLMIRTLLSFVLLSSVSMAQVSSVEISEEAPDSPWIELQPQEKLNLKLDQVFPPQSPISEVMSYQTSVKRQRSRGTCTIFTTVGLIEAHLKKQSMINQQEIIDHDLSEEWLEYLAMRNKISEGSTTSANMGYVLKHGLASEETWPYIGKKWLTLDDSPLALERCGFLQGDIQVSCLWGHRAPQLLDLPERDLLNVDHSLYDPEFVTIKKEAMNFLIEEIGPRFKVRKSFKIHDLKWVKTYLNRGYPIIMGLKLYYGSWNHSKTDKFSIQTRDKSKWYKGIVGYPEPGSKDRKICDEKGGGHSLIIVGYDDEKIINTRMQMEDGSWKEFSYKGVYYFKNSWGTHSFGRDFQFQGQAMPGYGMITQKYAHELGRFFHFPVFK